MLVLSLLFASVLLTANPALSGVVEGGITRQSGAGTFVQLDPSAGFAVGNDTFNTDHLYAFDEVPAVRLEHPLEVDIGGEGGVLPAGLSVASHYVFFDSVNGVQVGWVRFEAPILGIAALEGTLFASDYLGHPAVEYISLYLRGLERDDHVWIDAEDPRKLWVRWAGSSPGDYIRVFTEAQAVPMM